MQTSDWDDYRYFLAVVRAGSLSGAARSLGVNHATVLRRLASLEAQLGVRLFERYRSGYVATEAGERLAGHLGQAAGHIDAAQRQLQGLDAGLSGVVRVTTTDTLAHGLLIHALAAFRREQPGIQVQLVVNNAFLSLNKREADIAVRPANTPPEHLVGRPVGVIRTSLYAAPAYLAQAAVAGIARHDWIAHEWVVPDETLGHLAQAQWADKHVPDERIAMRLDSLLGMAAAIKEGVGMGMMLELLAGPELIQLAPPEPAMDTRVWVLTHPDLRKVQRIKAVTDYLVGVLRAHPHVINQ